MYKDRITRWEKIITTENSEIRTSGRNHKKIFTKKLFMNVLDRMKAVNVGDDKYEVSLNNELVEIVNGRGKSTPSRIKFNKVFFVDINNAHIEDDKIIFSINDVEQLKPSISMHIKVNATKDELKDYFENNN